MNKIKNSLIKGNLDNLYIKVQASKQGKGIKPLTCERNEAEWTITTGTHPMTRGQNELSH